MDIVSDLTFLRSEASNSDKLEIPGDLWVHQQKIAIFLFCVRFRVGTPTILRESPSYKTSWIMDLHWISRGVILLEITL